MSLTNDDLEQVLDYLKAHPESWMPAHVLDLAGRISTVEAELKAGRDVMVERFEALQVQIDRRFDATQKQMDERFESTQKQMDARFAASERRFETLQGQMNERFDQQSRHMNRWMMAMSTLIALIGVAVTVTNVMA
jgi:biopolymer transport protein ExbB/TolQ